MKPYETIQELLEAAKIHGPYVVGINNHIYGLITSIAPKSIGGLHIRIELSGHRSNIFTCEGLFRLYTWQDGSPCGKNE